MNDLSASSRITYGAVPVQPAAVRRIRGLSDKALAWLFITPTMVLLLAINIFPLIWTIYLSFTNYRANRSNAPVSWLGIDWYQTILTDPDIWAAMQVTAHFVFWTVVIETVLGFGLAFLIDKKFRGHGMWTRPPDLAVFGGHGYRVPGGRRRNMSIAMSSWAGSLPTRAAITAAQAASAGWAVTARRSRARPWSIGRPRRSISPSV